MSDEDRQKGSFCEEGVFVPESFGGSGLPGIPLGGGGRAGMIFPSTGLEIGLNHQKNTHFK